jgi:hypothetical protein
VSSIHVYIKYSLLFFCVVFCQVLLLDNLTVIILTCRQLLCRECKLTESMINRDEGTLHRLNYFCTTIVTPVDLKIVAVALVGEVLQRLCTETPLQIHLMGAPGHKARTLQYRVIEGNL